MKKETEETAPERRQGVVRSFLLKMLKKASILVLWKTKKENYGGIDERTAGAEAGKGKYDHRGAAPECS
jgi:hypothetical protein